MASYNFVITTFALALFVSHCQADFIHDVCSKPSNYPLCEQVLRSDPRSKRADLKGLRQIIIEKSIEAVKVASNVAKSVKTPKNKNVIETCIETQNNAIDNLIKCKTELKNANDQFTKNILNVEASAALTNVGTCADEFEGSQTQPPKLQQASQYAQELINVLLIIANQV